MIAAPSAAAMMADLGATVIKVEPLSGDIIRGLVLGDVSPDPWFELDNRGKQGIAVDLSTADGVAIVHRLAADADIFVTNLTPARQERFEMGEADIHAVAPSVVHASLSGYGTDGPLADTLAYDMTAFFARGGIQHMVAEPGGPPAAFRPGQGDHTTALSLLSAVLAALRLRDQTGEGQTVEVALYHVAAWTMSSDLTTSIVSGGEPARWSRAEWPSPMTGRFECADGAWIAFQMPGPKDFFPAFAACLGRPEWAADARYSSREGRAANAIELNEACDAIFATADRDTWAERLDQAGLTWAPVHTLEDIRNDEQAHELGIFDLVLDHDAGPFHTVNVPFRIRDADVGVRGRGPGLGEHSVAVLSESGWSDDEIAGLVERGIVGTLGE